MRKLVLGLAMIATVAGCSRSPQPPPFKTVVETKDLMEHVMERQADIVWGATGAIITAEGVEERKPKTEDDWIAVKAAAINLTETGNLLMMRAARAGWRPLDGQRAEDDGPGPAHDRGDRSQEHAGDVRRRQRPVRHLHQLPHALHAGDQGPLPLMSARVARGAWGPAAGACSAGSRYLCACRHKRPRAVLTGAVRDQTGGALPGVTVELLAARDVVATRQTAADGRYRFDGVAPGTYRSPSSC